LKIVRKIEDGEGIRAVEGRLLGRLKVEEGLINRQKSREKIPACWQVGKVVRTLEN
jgi:hypothetical protein